MWFRDSIKVGPKRALETAGIRPWDDVQTRNVGIGDNDPRKLC